MRNSRVIAGIAAAALAVVGISTSAHAEKPETLPQVASLHNPHIDLTREASRVVSSTSSNLTYHNGPVMTSPVTVQPIYWGKSWANTAFAGDKATGLAALYSQYGGSAYAGISAQYSQSGGAKVTTSVSNSAAIVDTASNASSVTADVFNEVLRQVPFDKLSSNGYYPVYTDLPRGTATYCAWHSVGTATLNGVSKRIKFAFFFSLDGDPGCDPGDTRTTYSQGTEALANVSAHELAEAMTDPELNAWYDRNGNENADKCAWKFNATGVTLLSGSYAWRIQGEWDNVTSACKW